MSSALPSFVVFLCIWFGFSHSANVNYVPSTNCSVFGCNFLDPKIWNPGVPSNGDNVTISTDVQITIFAISTNLSLSALTFGAGDTDFAGVDFLIQEGSHFNISSVLWGPTSSLSIESSSVVNILDSISGSSLFLENGSLNASSALIGKATVETSKCSGANWTISTGDFSSNSSSSFDSLSVQNLTSDGAVWNISNFNVQGSVHLMGGSLTAGKLLVSNYISFADTPANISTLNFMTPAGLLIANAPQSSSSFFVGTSLLDCTSEINSKSRIELNSITAIFTGGSICNLTVSDDVILNFTGNNELYNIQALDESTQINVISDQLIFHTPVPLAVDVSIMQDASLKTSGNVSIEGAISGPGAIYISANTTLTCDSVAVSDIYLFGITGGIHARTQINVSYISSDSPTPSESYVDAPEVFISHGAGIHLSSNNYLLFNGNLTQNGGYLNFTSEHLKNGTAPFVWVKGRVNLNGLTVVGVMPEFKTNYDKLILIKSQSKQLESIGTTLSSPKNHSAFSLQIKPNQYVYVERIPNFVKRFIIVFLIVGASLPFIVAAGIIAFLLHRRKKRGTYTQL